MVSFKRVICFFLFLIFNILFHENYSFINLTKFEKEEEKFIYLVSFLQNSEQISDQILLEIENLDMGVKYKNYIYFLVAKKFLEIKDFNDALNFLNKIDLNFIKSEFFLYEILKAKIKGSKEKGDYNKVILYCDEIGKMNINPIYKKEALLLKAEVMVSSTLKEEGIELLKKILVDYDSYSIRALNILRLINEDQLRLLKEFQKENMIRGFLRNGLIKEASLFYDYLEDKSKREELLSEILYKSRENDALFNLADKILERKDGSNYKIVERALWATLRIKDIERAKKYYDFLDSFEDNLLKSTANYVYGTVCYVNGDFKKALSYLERVEKNSRFYYNAHFKIAMINYLLEKKESKSIQILLNGKNPYREKVIFLLRNYFKKKLNDSQKVLSIYDLFFKKSFEIKEIEFFDEDFIGVLIKSGFFYFALNEVEFLKDFKKKEFLKKRILAKLGLYCGEFKGNLENIELTHPQPFKELIFKYANEYGIDPSLLFAIARNESRFNPVVLSNAGAYGLFQIMPKTASKIMGREVKEEELFDIEVNTKIAAKYLKRLYEIFGSDILVVAAYNTGEEVVSNWVKSFKTDDEYLFLLFIPYLETQNYCEKVLFDYQIYKKLLKR